MTIVNHQQLNNDDDDEFGGAVAKPYYRDQKNPVVDDDEFSGAVAKPYYRDQQKATETTITVEKELKKTESVGVILFAPKPENNEYLVDRESMQSCEDVEISTENPDIHIPLVIDTEFATLNQKEWQQKGRYGLTTQIRGIHEDAPSLIFVHQKPAQAINDTRTTCGLKPFPIVQTNFHPFDYLQACGIALEVAEIQSWEADKMPKCYITLYGHFLTAELNMIASGSIKNRLKELQKKKESERIEMGRRIRSVTPFSGIEADWVDLLHSITIDGLIFALRLRLVDTCAIHGIASYADFCKAVGVDLKFKDNFTAEQKGRMLDMALERPKDFENYALGDLEVYEALEAYEKQMKIVHEKLELKEYFNTPKLTIGGTVKDLFIASLAKKIGIVPNEENNNNWKKQLTEEIIKPYIEPFSAAELRHNTRWTSALLCKVEGGRCRNNRPTEVSIKRVVKDGLDVNIICDLDISSCYGNGQRNQDYFIGIPEIWQYKATSKNEYVTLRNWLKAYSVPIEKVIKGDFSDWGDLVYGSWLAIINTKETLTYPQDLFASWFTSSGYGTDVMAKFVAKMGSDTELNSTEWVEFDEEYGDLKIFNHEIWNAKLTHDSLEWIFAIASPRQRNEMLDKLVVTASAVYPNSSKVSSLEELVEKYKNWDGHNITERLIKNGRKIIQMTFDECHAWIPMDLGELLVNNLLTERKIAQIQSGKKSPLDTLFKLCTNTLYGDMVSKFFVTSNAIVGNNITARARVTAWYMEKGLNGWQSITDGCAFELNGVLATLADKRADIDGETTNLHRPNSKLAKRNLKTQPLGEKPIGAYWTEYVEYSPTKKEGTKKYVLGLKLGDEDLAPIIKDDTEKPGFQKAKCTAYSWIEKTAMKHLQKTFPLVSILHQQTKDIKVNEKTLKCEFTFKTGMYAFEVKDLYHSAAFHGSANYIFVNPNETICKARGYEIKRPHTSIDNQKIAEGDESLIYKSDRYGAKNNPAKDLLLQILENPESVKRQQPAIKSGILKVGQFKNYPGKYEMIGLEPGDNILKLFLMQEFSLTQFTFQTYDQYINWKKRIERAKETDKQSLETFFLNPDGTLNFKLMCETVDQMIAEGVLDPYDYLDKHDNRWRVEKQTKEGEKTKGRKAKKLPSLRHPYLDVYLEVKEKLNNLEESTNC